MVFSEPTLSEPTLLQLKIKLKKEKDINIMNQIQLMIHKKIEDSRDRWWFKKKFFEEVEYDSSSESSVDLENEINKPRSLDRFLLDAEIINNYSKHIDKPYVLGNNKPINNKPINKKNNNLGRRKNIV